MVRPESLPEIFRRTSATPPLVGRRLPKSGFQLNLMLASVRGSGRECPCRDCVHDRLKGTGSLILALLPLRLTHTEADGVESILEFFEHLRGLLALREQSGVPLL